MHCHLKVFPLTEKDQAKVHLTTKTTIITFFLSRMNYFRFPLNN